MEMDRDFKKMSVGRRGAFYHHYVFFLLPPHPPYATDPMIIIYPFNLKGYMISMGSAA